MHLYTLQNVIASSSTPIKHCNKLIAAKRILLTISGSLVGTPRIKYLEIEDMTNEN